MSEAGHTLISLLLPEGILDYFDLLKVEKDSTGLNIYLEEKNIVPGGYLKHELKPVSRIFLFGGRKLPYALKDADGQCSAQEK